jgi:hypothetical protein
MIRYPDVVPMLRAACPSFDTSAEAELVEDGSGEFVHVGYFVAHLVDLVHLDRTDSFAAVFGVVERVLIEGDLEARNLVVAGFLDDLANLYRRDHRGPNAFEPWLGPRTRRVPGIAVLIEGNGFSDPRYRDESFS